MTIIRSVDAVGDWTFGRGQGNYLTGNLAVEQDINTRLACWLGDCFFDLGAGIDWRNLLGGKDQTALALAISAVILNTQYVTQMLQLSLNLNRKTRAFSVQYQVATVYSTITSVYTLATSIGG